MPCFAVDSWLFVQELRVHEGETGYLASWILLYSYTVFVSVHLLYRNGLRLSDFKIKAQTPVIGYLLLARRPSSGRMTARLVDAEGKDQLEELDGAEVVECKGRAGMLLRGRQYRAKGRKDAYVDQQQWWCQAPPARGPMIDADAMRREQNARYVADGLGFPD